MAESEAIEMGRAMPDSAGGASTIGKIRRRFATLAFITAVCTYALIVFGGIVRITGSGMGCGDDWPLCNGQLIPPMDFETLIEYGHRLAAAAVGFLVLGVAVYAWLHRRTPGIGNRGVVGWSIASLVLLVAQVLVGAVTVWLELPASTVVLHLTVASVLLATLTIAGLRALSGPARLTEAGASYPRWALISAALGFLLLVLGAMVANTGAAPLCQGFPLCNGQLVPEGGGLVHLHWTHRLIAYALIVVMAIAVARTIRQGAPAAVRRSALVAMHLAVVQVVVAAAMVLMQLPDSLRALHLAVGAGLWAALVVWAALGRWQVGTLSAAEAAG